MNGGKERRENKYLIKKKKEVDGSIASEAELFILLLLQTCEGVTVSEQANVWCEAHWRHLSVCVCVLQDWEVRYHRDTPLTPRQDVNAPDLYIPSTFSSKWQHSTGATEDVHQ